MTADRAEWTGVGAAIAFHAALIAALSMSLAHITRPPEPPSMEVELVDDVALQSAAPAPIAPPSPPPPAAPAPDQSLPTQPMPDESIAMTAPVQRPTAMTQRPTAAPARPVQRPGIGKDFLKSFDDDLSPRAGPSRPAAPAYSATARSNVANSIVAQAQRCADRQTYLGEGADQLRVQVRLSFARSGRLARPPDIGTISGDGNLRDKYGDLLEDQVRRIFADCAPFRLPADLYDTENGGWKETTLSYRVRK